MCCFCGCDIGLASSARGGEAAMRVADVRSIWRILVRAWGTSRCASSGSVGDPADRDIHAGSHRRPGLHKVSERAPAGLS